MGSYFAIEAAVCANIGRGMSAGQPLLCANWAAGVGRQFMDLGMGSPFNSSRVGALTSLHS